MSALPKRYFTPEEYLALEETADYRSQYIDGEIFAMSGAASPHVIIQSNLIGELHNHFRGKGCAVFSSDMRVRAKHGGMYTYPDVAALCGKAEFDFSSNPESLLNPQAIFEVLSPSTEAFDRGDKFTRYRKLESLTDYVLIASTRRWAEHFTLQPNGVWSREEHDRPEHRLRLASLNCELSLSEIYAGVEFPDNGRGAARGQAGVL